MLPTAIAFMSKKKMSRLEEVYSLFFKEGWGDLHSGVLVKLSLRWWLNGAERTFACLEKLLLVTTGRGPELRFENFPGRGFW